MNAPRTKTVTFEDYPVGGARQADVLRISTDTLAFWLKEGHLNVTLNLDRNEARALGSALLSEANRPYEEDDNG
jgi:hypothetical protein